MLALKILLVSIIFWIILTSLVSFIDYYFYYDEFNWKNFWKKFKQMGRYTFLGILFLGILIAFAVLIIYLFKI